MKMKKNEPEMLLDVEFIFWGYDFKEWKVQEDV